MPKITQQNLIKELEESGKKAHPYGVGFYQKEKLQTILSDEDTKHVLTLLATYESVIEHLTAAQKLREDVEGMKDWKGNQVYDSWLGRHGSSTGFYLKEREFEVRNGTNYQWRTQRDQALADFDNSLKD